MKKIFTLFILSLFGLLNVKAQSSFSPGNLVVYRIGSGSGSLVNTGNPIFLDEYTVNGVLVQSVALPTTASGSNQPLFGSGTASSEGLLTLSSDGRYLVATGYANTSATSLSGTTATAVNRVIARIDANASINSSTALTDYASSNNPRSATTNDGTAFWMAGGAGGIRYAALGSTTSTQITTGSLVNFRQVNIFGNQLYATTQSTTGSNTIPFGAVGSGLPTTASSATYTALTGLPALSGTSYYAFFFADLSTSVAGNDVLYIVDDGTNTINKFSLVGGSWTSNGTVTASSIRGLTGIVNGASVTLFGTTGGTSATGGGSIYKVVDASGYNATITGSVSTIASASSNTAFRGIAIVPSYVWSGATNTDWNTATNWLNGSVPPSSSTTQITVPYVTTGNYPSLTSSFTVGDIAVMPGASLSVASSQTLTVSGKLYLKSDITGTSSIGNSAGSISGSVSIERYIPSKRAFRFLASPVSTSTFISGNWQSSFGASSGVGTHITGSSSGANGFDATATGNPSMFIFDNSAQTWSSVANTNATNLAAGTGYRILIRGDRTTDLSNNSATPSVTTLVAVGTLTTGSKTFNSSSSPSINTTTNNFSLIGNPYASSVDWDVLTKSNLSTTYWIWDPNLSTSGANRGGYVSWTTGSGASNTSGVTGTSGMSNAIQSGQAFFVQTTGGSPTLTFAESNKLTTSSNATFDTKIIKPRINISLNLLGEQDAADATAIVFDKNFTNAVSNEDAPKLENPYENIAVAINGKLVGLEGHSSNFLSDTIQLNLWKLGTTHYEFKINTENFSQLANTDISLLDKYTNTKTKIDLSQDNIISFDITDAASKAADRFAIVVTNTKPSIITGNTTANQFAVTATAVKSNITVKYAAPKAGLTTIRLISTNGTVLQVQNLGVQQNGRAILSTTSTANNLYFVEVKVGEYSVTKKVINNN